MDYKFCALGTCIGFFAYGHGKDFTRTYSTAVVLVVDLIKEINSYRMNKAYITGLKC